MEQLTHFQEDVLTDILQELRLQGTLYCYARLGAPWGFGIPQREIVGFHLVTSGTCWLHVGQDLPLQLHEGDLVILPHGHAHAVTDCPTSAVTRLEDLLEEQPDKHTAHFTQDGDGDVSTLICGGIRVQSHLTNPLFLLLPTVMHLRSADEQSLPQLRAIIEVVKAEAGQNRLATEVVVTRLSEVLFIQAVRAYLSVGGTEKPDWFKALKDPCIGQALVVMHHESNVKWTVASLAQRVSLSRSAFSARFTHLVGEPPMQYLARVRLTKATSLLQASSAVLLEVARAVGYDSEVTFSKAFKRWFGTAPGTYRQGGTAL
jgi:AraC family transcriptional regulator, alkane utilization regulator